MRFFRDNVSWAQTQEREFRVFAEDSGLKRHNFKPMIAPHRAFIHSLAEDFGLDSQSLDPEPLRHVSLFKTPRFVSAPMKTLAQCLRIMRTALPAPVSNAPSASAGSATPYNALLLSSPRFGLTIDDVDTTLAPALASHSSSTSTLPLTFTTTFLASDEVVITASAPPITAATIARAGPPATPAAIESALAALKPAVQRAVTAAGLSAAAGNGSITLCHVDAGLRVVRREGDGADGTGAGGWSAVVGRAAKRTVPSAWGAASGAAAGSKPTNSFLVLRKVGMEPKKKEVLAKKEVDVVEDWEAAVENEEADRVEETQGVAAVDDAVTAPTPDVVS